MYCPRCGQEQVAGELRFCPTCGLPMGLVAELLANGGTLPQLLELAKNNKFFTKKNGVFFSIFWFIFLVPIMTSFWGIMGVDEMAGISAIFGVFGSILILIFSLIFLPSSAKSNADAHVNAYPGQLPQAQPQGALPPQQTQPAQDYVSPPGAGMWKAPDTGELARPGSVTEGTTRLLQKDESE